MRPGPSSAPLSRHPKIHSGQADGKDLSFSIYGLAGSVGDFGTILPLAIALAASGALLISPMLLFLGIWFIITGFYYRCSALIEPIDSLNARLHLAPVALVLALLNPFATAQGIVAGGTPTSTALTMTAPSVSLLTKISPFGGPTADGRGNSRQTGNAVQSSQYG